MHQSFQIIHKTPVNRNNETKPFPLEWLHQHLEEIVGIWCNQDAEFNINWIQDETLKSIIRQNHGFKSCLIKIHDYCRNAQNKIEVRNQLKQAFEENTQIQNLCDGHGNPIKYEDLPADIRNILKNGICNYLYDNLRKTTAYTDNYESFKSYFDTIIRESEMKVCPFCGLHDLKSEYEQGRDAFDHYLPKSIYPFVSIKANNLFPICHECNSDEKKTKDILFNIETQQRRHVFYPLAINHPSVEVMIDIANIRTFDASHISKSEFAIQVNVAGYEHQVNTWNWVFDIENRYASWTCKKFERWTRSWRKDYQKSGKELNQYVIDKLDCFDDDRLLDQQFLKYALLSCLYQHDILADLLQPN